MQSPESATPSILLNGNLVPEDTAVLKASDGALSFGHALFETMAVYRGKVFALQPHYERLQAGAARLDLSIPSLENLSAQIASLIAANELSSTDKSRLRVTVTPDQTIITTSPRINHPAAARTVTVTFTRNDTGALAGYKTINYGENVVAQRQAKEAGADEALFPNTRDELCEGTWSNIFVRINGKWLTPPASSGCLAGVTRSIILAISGDRLPLVSETAIPMSALSGADAAFLTSSIREIQPVATINGRKLSGLDCQDTTAFQRAFREYVITNG